MELPVESESSGVTGIASVVPKLFQMIMRNGGFDVHQRSLSRFFRH